MDALVSAPPPGQSPATRRALGLETIGMSKIFGRLVALDDVSIRIEPARA